MTRLMGAGGELTYPDQCFFPGPLGGEISPQSFKFPPQTLTTFKRPAGCFSHFLSPQKQFPPLNYNSRKNPDPDGTSPHIPGAQPAYHPFKSNSPYLPVVHSV